MSATEIGGLKAGRRCKVLYSGDQVREDRIVRSWRADLAGDVDREVSGGGSKLLRGYVSQKPRRLAGQPYYRERV